MVQMYDFFFFFFFFYFTSGEKAIHIQQKPYSGFWILIFSLTGDMQYETLS